jgi:hypothetical protein
MKPASACFLVLLMASAASAASITYTATVTADGSIGSTSFNEVPVVYTLVSDTASVISTGFGFQSGSATGTFAIPSLNILATTLDQWYFLTNSAASNVVLVNSAYGGGLMFANITGLNSYDLASDFGPSLSNFGGFTFNPTSTDLGQLTVSATYTQVTFRATVSGDGGGEVPEPATSALVGLGLIGAAAYRRYVRRSL